MFDDLVECSPSGKKKTKQGTTVFMSMLFQVGLLALMLIIPLLVTPALPKSFLATMLTAPPPPAAPPPPPPAAPVVHVRPTAHLIEAGKLIAPKSIPKDVNIIKEDAPPPDLGASQVTGGVVGGVPGGQIGGVLGGIIGGGVSTAAPPPPPPPAPVQTRITKGGDVMMATAMNKVQPVYPQLARQARVQGTVRLHTLIDKDGKVIEVTYQSGPAMLVQSAIDAVKQWRFHPTMLNNTPVQVECVFELNFNLGGG
jgi:periplasmic protein TonB